ncbi:MAG: NAD-dependent dehydratase [Sideroxydans sp.]|nr:NAD-dependent dehydratase [Sideroxydans sp.]
MSHSVLITGASGFVGRALCIESTKRGMRTKAVTRIQSKFDTPVTPIILSSIDGETEWGNKLNEVDVVIHLAARVHVMKDLSADPFDEFRKVNVEGTVHLARCAAKMGVKRFVYVSSIKVNGEETACGEKYSESSLPSPQDPYGCSKWEAEQALGQIGAETGLEIVIIRPPLVYGAGVKGNFVQMLKVLSKCLPLPLASVKNQRSLVYVNNLADALITCALHPRAAGQTFLVSDGEDISTPDLLRNLGVWLGHPALLFPCTQKLLIFLGRLVGKSDQVQRLLGSLQIDSGKIRRELNWTPPFTLQQGLQATAEWYRKKHL